LTPLFCGPGCYCETKESLEAYAARARPPPLRVSIVIAEKQKEESSHRRRRLRKKREIRHNLRERHSFAAPKERNSQRAWPDREEENSHFKKSGIKKSSAASAR
jgi:hypothetical protein